MKLKSLLLGSAAGLFAVTGAQAADLPVAEPVEYVRVCDAFGAGFFYIPGTDTCLKVGGRVRVEAHYTHGFDDDNNVDRGEGEDFDGRRGRTRIFDPINEASPDETRGYNNFTTRARGYMNLDARTQTDFGVVRAYVQFFLTNGPDVGPGDNVNYSVTGPNLDEAFVTLTNDFGVFTAGHTFTKFDFFRGYAFDTIIGSDDPSDNVTLFAYTFTAAEGFSGTISVEDPRSIGRDVSIGGLGRLVAVDNNDDGAVTTFATVDEDTPDGIHGGQRTPDLVGNLRFDGGFGSAQIMGVLRDVRTSEFAIDNSVEGADGDTELGYAFGAGGTLKVPNTNIEASLQGVYGEGAIGYVTTGNGAPTTDGIVQRVTRITRTPVLNPDGTQKVNRRGDPVFETRTDALFTDDIDLTEAYAINAGVSVGLTETITASITGSYADVEFGDEGDDGGNRGGTRGRLRDGRQFTPRLVEDYDTWTLSGNLSVTPIAGLLAGIEVEYENVDFDNDDERGRRGSSSDDSGFDDNDDEEDRFGGMIRIQRTF